MKPFQLRDKKTGKLRYGGQWLIRFRDPSGEWRRMVGGKTRKLAAATLRAIEVDVQRGEWVDPRRKQNEEPQDSKAPRTWGQLVDLYIASRPMWRQNTHNNFGYAVKSFLPVIPYSMPLTRCTRELCKKAIAHIEASDISSQTARIRAQSFRGVWRWAMREELIANDPAVGLLTAGKKKGPREIRDQEVLTADEMIQLIQVAHETRPQVLTTMIVVALHTGLRRGELCGLKWKDIDFEKGFIRIERQYDCQPTKSNRPRTIPILPELVPTLKAWRLAAPLKDDDAPLFPGLDGQHRSRTFGWSRLVREVASEAGITKRLTGHSTRHTFASRWIARGGRLTPLSRILGHCSTSFTESIYIHLLTEDLTHAANELEPTCEPTHRLSKPVTEPTVDFSQNDKAQ